jgi:hypothetical protein
MGGWNSLVLVTEAGSGVFKLFTDFLYLINTFSDLLQIFYSSLKITKIQFHSFFFWKFWIFTNDCKTKLGKKIITLIGWDQITFFQFFKIFTRRNFFFKKLLTQNLSTNPYYISKDFFHFILKYFNFVVVVFWHLK